MERLTQLVKDNRFYTVEIRQDIFGDLVVVLRWGSLKIEWERQKEIPAKSQAHAEMLFENTVSKKLRRGIGELKQTDAQSRKDIIKQYIIKSVRVHFL